MRSLFYKPPSYDAPTPRPAPLRNRSFVAVYHDAAQSRFITYGQIIDAEWRPVQGAYSYTVISCQHGTELKCWDFHARPVAPEEIRQLFILIRNPIDMS